MLISQNLIPNGSFEEGKCPQSYSTKVQDFKVDHWFVPDTGTPDYFHSCSSGDSGVPSNWAGAARPIDGEAYVGIYLSSGAYMEHLSVELTEPMIKDSVYFGEFYVHPSIYAKYFPQTISVAITDERLNHNVMKGFDLRMANLSIVWDLNDLNWLRLSFEYKAKGGEKYLTIGKLTTYQTAKISNPYFSERESMLKNASYLYIDEVSLRGKYLEPILMEELENPVYFEITYPLFDFGKHEIQEEYTYALDSLAKQIMGDSLVYEIIGKTDSVGSESYNYELGRKRAESVVNYLISQGINPNRLTVTSTGEWLPMMSNVDEKGRSQNRTVVIRIKK